MSPRPFARGAHWEALGEGPFDLVVVGGGATGSGVALDAATRGLRVALVERGDFACGTSGRSTKLVHGGVRYLERAVKRLDRSQFQLVRDALRERRVMLHLAPHLTRVLPIVTPLHDLLDVPYYRVGLKLYDWLAGSANLAPSRFLDAQETCERVPALRREGLRGSVLYHDGQFDDARTNLAIVRTAAAHGAVTVNHAEVVGLEKRGGRVRAAWVRDRLGAGGTREVPARVVVNGAGPFGDAVRRMDDPHAEPMLVTSTGAHVVLPGRFAPRGTGLLVPETDDGRVLFCLPWMGRALVGTTDVAASPQPEPRPTQADVGWLLRSLSAVLQEPALPEDVQAAWTGIRPLVLGARGGDTAWVSRDHVIAWSPSGLLTVAGGKWTTWRLMAEEAVDAAIQGAGLSHAGPCVTQATRLVGAAGWSDGLADDLARRFGLARDVARRLAEAYGGEAEEVARRASDGLGARLAPPHPLVEAEVVHAAEREMAVRAADVLERRTRLAFLDAGAARFALPRVVALLGGRLGWDDLRREEEREAALASLRGLEAHGLEALRGPERPR